MNAIGIIERALNNALGLKPRSGAAARLERELRKLHQELGLNVEEVARRIAFEPRLVRRLACALTVEETFLLRQPEHFELLVEYVRKRLLKSAEPLVLWSAGCASGEEPYSMAIAIHRALGSEALSRTSIIATDVDEVALRRAEDGLYGVWSFRGTSPQALSAYFERKAGADEYRVTPQVRGAVRFEHSSLQEQLVRFAPASIDAVFFRNVAIYLTAEALGDLYVSFGRVLKEGGLLVLGPADPLPASGQFVRTRVHDTLVYHRAKSVSVPASVPPAAHASLPLGRLVLPRTATAVDARNERAAALTAAHKLADRGRTGEALSTLSEQLERFGQSSELLGLRGRIYLAEGDADSSAEDLQAALALNPSHARLRFDYALALEALQQSRACRTQLQVLLDNLEARSDADALLPDVSSDRGDATTVRSLRQAAHELLRRIE